MPDEIRKDMVTQAIDQAQFANSGNVNQSYQGRIDHIQNNQLINDKEKEAAIRTITVNKDFVNFMELKEQTYPCDICSRAGFTILNCEHCVRDALRSDFSSWTSGNDAIDNAIKEAQETCPLPERTSEWIDYEDLEDVKYLTKGGCANIWTAIWTKGLIESLDKERRQFMRSEPWHVVLKQLANSNNPNEEFLKEVTLVFSNAY